MIMVVLVLRRLSPFVRSSSWHSFMKAAAVKESGLCLQLEGHERSHSSRARTIDIISTCDPTSLAHKTFPSATRSINKYGIPFFRFTYFFHISIYLLFSRRERPSQKFWNDKLLRTLVRCVVSSALQRGIKARGHS